MSTYESPRDRATIDPLDYGDKFRDYVASTDEKAVIAGAIGHLLSGGTILDIGAGTGDIPELLGIHPSRYTAVERRAEFVRLLQSKGYSVIASAFPCDIPGTFDNVLMSHVLFKVEQCEKMIPAAWDLASDPGLLVAVTYRDNGGDDYNKLMERIGFPDSRSSTTDEHFQYIQTMLASLGRTSLTTVRSHLYSPDLQSMATSLSAVATNFGTFSQGDEIRDAIAAEKPYLDGLYRTSDGSYEFPADHYIFATHKE